MNGWIGVDLDGTLAEYNGWQGPTHIGPPVEPMLRLVKRMLSEGVDVRIMTARISDPDPEIQRQVRRAITKWCDVYVGTRLPITCTKDFGMIALYDDRAVSVVQNTGELLASPELLRRAFADAPVTP